MRCEKIINENGVITERRKYRNNGHLLYKICYIKNIAYNYHRNGVISSMTKVNDASSETIKFDDKGILKHHWVEKDGIRTVVTSDEHMLALSIKYGVTFIPKHLYPKKIL